MKEKLVDVDDEKMNCLFMLMMMRKEILDYRLWNTSVRSHGFWSDTKRVV